MQAARKAAGIDGKTMMMIGTVATLPAKQGRGYGTLLCKIVIEEVSTSYCLHCYSLLTFKLDDRQTGVPSDYTYSQVI